jgi:large subunit ribosomal protein L18e
MLRSKNQIAQRTSRKRNPELVETLKACKHNDAWRQVGIILARPSKMLPEINLGAIDAQSKEGDLIVVPGKVLSQGNIGKKVRVIALRFSASAKDKLKEKKGEAVSILDEIKINPKAEGIKIIA